MIAQNKVNQLMDLLTGKIEKLSSPAAVYLGICTEEPTAETGAVSSEPTAECYKRVLIAGYGVGTANNFGSASEGVIKNIKEIHMNTARTNYGTMKYWFLSATEPKDSNAYMWGKIYDEEGNWGLTVNEKTVPVFYEGDLQASIDVELTPSSSTSTETTTE